MWSGTKTPSRPSSSARVASDSASATVSCQMGRTTPYFMAISATRPGGRRAQDLVPGAGEPALLGLGRVRERPVPAPLAARQLVVDLEPVAVRIGEVHADRDGVVGDVERNAASLQPLVHLGEILEGRHSPGDVVQADLTLLGRGRVLTHLEERDVVRVAGIAGQEGRSE